MRLPFPAILLSSEINLSVFAKLSKDRYTGATYVQQGMNTSARYVMLLLVLFKGTHVLKSLRKASTQ